MYTLYVYLTESFVATTTTPVITTDPDPCQSCPGNKGYTCMVSELVCYRYQDQSGLNPTQSRDVCVNEGGDLIRIDTAQKQTIVEGILGKYDSLLLKTLIWNHYANEVVISNDCHDREKENNMGIRMRLFVVFYLTDTAMLISELTRFDSFYIFSHGTPRVFTM